MKQSLINDLLHLAWEEKGYTVHVINHYTDESYITVSNDEHTIVYTSLLIGDIDHVRIVELTKHSSHRTYRAPRYLGKVLPLLGEVNSAIYHELKEADVIASYQDVAEQYANAHSIIDYTVADNIMTYHPDLPSTDRITHVSLDTLETTDDISFEMHTLAFEELLKMAVNRGYEHHQSNGVVTIETNYAISIRGVKAESAVFEPIDSNNYKCTMKGVL